MVYIKGGEVAIGNDAAPAICRPAHTAALNPFYIDVKEVTNAEYERFDPAHRAKRLPGADGDDIPVTNVTWEEAGAYCAWLSQQEAVVCRLPSEAEWECAAKGGTDAPYSSGGVFEGRINVGANAPVPASAYPPNGFGLLNMSGNVWEFCLDWIGPYASGRQVNPVNNDPGEYKARVVRGGSFAAQRPDITATVFMRNGLPPDKPFRDTGFRCVRETGQ
jgi:formylglycine-generating enzyme required for sulfatase activity